MIHRWHFAGTAGILLLTTAAVRWSAERKPKELARPLESIATEIAGWRVIQSDSLPVETADLLKATAYLNRQYRQDGADLMLSIAYFSRQRAGEAMHTPKNCFPGSGWEIWQQGSAKLPFRGGTVTINRFVIQNSGQRLLVYYWYQSRQRIIANEYLGKILLARDAIVDADTGGSLVRIIVPDTPEAARDALTFASEVILEMQRCLEG